MGSGSQSLRLIMYLYHVPKSAKTKLCLTPPRLDFRRAIAKSATTTRAPMGRTAGPPAAALRAAVLCTCTMLKVLLGVVNAERPTCT